MSPTYDAVFQWLMRYGPLWVNGIGHITVIAGIKVTPSSAQFLVYDPLPQGQGSIEWRDVQKWYTGTVWPVTGAVAMRIVAAIPRRMPVFSCTSRGKPGVELTKQTKQFRDFRRNLSQTSAG